ncbi:flagellar motor switch phosphatase FliY [Alkaliphilus peptidifermentans]|uniref:Flagellar motor switch protein FliN/FliY n=1 Tax=Alkaliphilus peptidifermentans DSM 18978 TaxID=1120976 RepID=A0A1G5DH34_9FIRM|nr:flagellar motor switch phosphatase FliY [Alkaliphilus peptidifermentans]SCY13874.1 flagellar motor switch protein FliN/FliY [Alkaliphilus peptidifermentans DSM 18978]
MSDMLSQEEIDALLRGASDDVSFQEDEFDFTDDEKDTIGEIGNISMGTAATTLSTLLGNRVNITTPKVSLLALEDLMEEYPIPFVAVDVQYKEGLEGLNVLVMKDSDVKIITDLMMGGSGQASEEPLSDIHLSAIGEAMNQMVGSSSTSLSEMFSKKIDIYPPRVFPMDLSTDKFIDLFPEFTMKFVRISFSMVIGDLIDSEIMQLIPLDFAKEMVNKLMYNYADDQIEDVNEISINISQVEEKIYERPNQTTNEAAYRTAPQSQPRGEQPVNVQPVQFQSFDQATTKGMPENIDLIQDVPLNVTVELGRTVKRISEILEFGPGTIIELDKLVGEPLDILVNGQYVAKGEVVVIDENYGIRITDIVSSAKRFAKI